VLVVGVLVVGVLVVGVPSGGRTRNQLLGNPTARGNVSPPRVTEPADPTRVTEVTRPPQSPRPLRVTSMLRSLPMVGQRDSMLETDTVRVQSCHGFPPD
jgi:hypothetical protein